MVWKVGQSGNPSGRAREASRDKEALKYRAMAEAQNLIDPILFQHQLLEDKAIPYPVRAQIAANITPYFYYKLGVIIAPKFVASPIHIPSFQSAEEAEDFLLSLSQQEAAGQIDSESAGIVHGRVLDWIHSKRVGQDLAIKQANANQLPGDQVIRIEGGLPPLPGTDIIMGNDHMIDHQPGESLPMESLASRAKSTIPPHAEWFTGVKKEAAE
ncbi:hypothetical protein QD460_23850 [Rhizobium jaguaris]|uniref:hypothetical protein n=1 Tax=Rhizobium jaguaris TaxID=1312183 RepID=UPI0039BF0882